MPVSFNLPKIISSSIGPKRTTWHLDLVVGKSCSIRVHSRMIQQYPGGSSRTLSRQFCELTLSFSASLTMKTFLSDRVGRVETFSMRNSRITSIGRSRGGFLALPALGDLVK